MRAVALLALVLAACGPGTLGLKVPTPLGDVSLQWTKPPTLDQTHCEDRLAECLEAFHRLPQCQHTEDDNDNTGPNTPALGP